MLSIWQLPQKASIGGREYDLHTDYRDILEIFAYLNDDSLPDFLKWQIALGLFYRQSVQREHLAEAVEYMRYFISGGDPQEQAGPKLLDWQLDAACIVSDINRAAGQDVRQLQYVHWWTFLSWFHAIGPGQLSMLVSVRDKLRTGKKLEDWEKDFYRKNKDRVDMKKPLSLQEQQQKLALERLLE